MALPSIGCCVKCELMADSPKVVKQTFKHDSWVCTYVTYTSCVGKRKLTLYRDLLLHHLEKLPGIIVLTSCDMKERMKECFMNCDWREARNVGNPCGLGGIINKPWEVGGRFSEWWLGQFTLCNQLTNKRYARPYFQIRKSEQNEKWRSRCGTGQDVTADSGVVCFKVDKPEQRD